MPYQPAPDWAWSVTAAVELRETIAALNAVGGEVCDALPSASDGNVLFAPVSLISALAIASLGATGHSYEQFTGFFRATNGLDVFHNALQRLLAASHDPTSLSQASSLYINERFAIQPRFLDRCQTIYDASVTPIDCSQSQESASDINGWIASKTGGAD